jgi:hypothetical protein
MTQLLNEKDKSTDLFFDDAGLEATMCREIFRQVAIEAEDATDNEDEADEAIDLTLKKLFGIFIDLKIESELRLVQLVKNSNGLTSEKFLDVYLSVVANGQSFDLVLGELKEYTVEFNVEGTAWVNIAGVEDEEVSWTHQGQKEVMAFGMKRATEIVESLLQDDTNSDHWDMQDTYLT